MDSKIYRKRPFDDVHAWLDLLLMANYEEGEVMIGRTVEKVERGSLITSIVNLSERWGWSRNKTREFIKFLENENMIVRKSDNKKTCIKIVNYSVYQNLETANETAKNQITAPKIHNQI